MRKIVAGAVVAAALTWAQGARADDAAKERREAADATKQEARQEAREAKESTRRAGERAEQRMEGAADRTRSETQAARPSGRQDGDKKHPLFEGKNNFDLDGKVQAASQDKVTIQRDDLPAVTLHVSPDTKVEVDGKQASASQLKQGQDVKASFNLHGERAEAVEIKADKLEGGDRREMTEQRREAQKEMSERRREAQEKK